MPLSPTILGAVLIFGIMLGAIYVMGITKKWGILIPFAGMLLSSSMAKPIEWNEQIVQTIWLPVQSIRSQLFLASGLAGLLVVIVNLHRLRGKGQSPSMWVLVFAGLYAATLRFAHDTAGEGAMSILFSLSTVIPLALTAGMVMEKAEDILILFRTVMVVNLIWIGMVMVQFAVNPNYVTMGAESRFVGMLSNPQHTGVLMAFFAVISLWMLLVDSRKYRIFYIGLVGLNFLLLMWTGSRTGLGMGLIGVSAVMYARAGRAILLVPIVGITSYGVAKLLVNVMGIDLGFSRLGSTSDTRSFAWMSLIETGMNNMGIGIGTYESSYSENSWLYGFAAYGIGMLLLLLLMAMLAIFEGLKLLKLRYKVCSEYRPMYDVTLGLFAMYFAGAMLEGYIIARVSAMLCFYPLLAGIGAVLRKPHMAFGDSVDTYEYDEEYTDSDGYEDEYT